MHKRKSFFTYIASCILYWSANVLSQASNLRLDVEVSGAAPERGQIICSLFNSKKTFLDQPVLQVTHAVDEAGRVLCRFEKLSSGDYAVSAIYDKDSNGILNTGLFGIPAEPVGISNNPKSRLGPPSYRKAVFSLQESESIEINLVDAN